jgi:hypothetical protein
MSALYFVATIQYGSPIDVITPAVAAAVFLAFAVQQFMGGARFQRQYYDPENYRSFGRFARFVRPRRMLPERFDGLTAVLNGIVCLLGAALFLSIALSVVLD